MTPHALGEAVARDLSSACVADRIVDRRVRSAGRKSGSPPHRRVRHRGAHNGRIQRLPSSATSAARFLGAWPKVMTLQSSRRRPGWQRRMWHSRDRCNLVSRQWSADRLQQSESEGAARSVDDEIRRNRLARAVAVLVAHAGDRLSFGDANTSWTRSAGAACVRAAFHRRRTARSIVGRDRRN